MSTLAAPSHFVQSGMEVERTGSMIGEVMVSRAGERVLEAAHH